jgi:hypothetical protein
MARPAQPKPQSGKIAPDDPEQFQRFVEAARELGADTPDAVEATDRALRRMLPSREPGKAVERRAAEPKPKRTYQKKKTLP